MMMGRIYDTLQKVVNNFIFKHFILTGAFLFLIVISFALYLIFQNAQMMRDQINEDFNQQQLVLARQAATLINAHLGDIRSEIESLDRFIQAGISNKALKEAMEALAERTRNKGVAVVAMADSRGELINSVSNGEKYELEINNIPVFCRNSGEISINRINIDIREDSSDVIAGTLCKQVNIPGADNNGYLIVKIDISKLTANVTENIHSGKTGYAWVINQDGMFLYHPDQQFIGKNAFTARKEREPYISFAQINQIMKDRMLQGKEGTGIYESGWHQGTKGRITKLIAYTPVNSPMLRSNQIWSVAVAAPTTEVADVVEAIYTRHFLAEAAIIASIIVFGFVAIIYQRRISKSLEKQVSEQEKYMSSILQNSVDAIIFIDVYNRVKLWNRGAEMIFGYTAEEMMGRTFHRLIPPDMDAEEELQRIHKDVLGNGYIRHYRTKRKTKDGRVITIDLSRTLLRSDTGEILGSTAIIKDITDTVELEQRIYNTEKLASIGTLAAGVAHEINNPIAIILGFTDLLLEKYTEGDQEYEDLKMIEENANHAKTIVENMLGFARVTEGLEDTVDVRQSLETVASIIQNTLMTKKVRFELDIGDELPEIRGDAREYQQVIFNLTNNAIQAMEPAGGNLKIKAHAEDHWVHVDISDTGEGIPDELKRKIFDPFFTTKKVGKGTGLGLSLCYGIVNKFGGKITFKSSSRIDRPDRPSGTTFTVSMPVGKTEKSAQGGKIETEHPGNR
ncbi:MAG: PAS domain S-box protein [candidate division Zixibacteria bacterium]|nr:PAS domain S-box protein [candidate division Zixibacteria bacterium]